MGWFAVVASVFATAQAPIATAPPPAVPPAPIEVMVLGTYHFDSPGLDLNNPEVDDVRTPKRQRELDAVARAVARFRPTMVAIERRIAGADLVDRRYEDYDEGNLRTDKDERIQLGYRIARLAGVRVVHGIDEQPEGGEPDYFPYGTLVAYAKRSGKEIALDRVMAAGPAATARFEAMQRMQSIGALLADWNDPANPVADQSIYYGMLGIGDTRAQPGADLNAAWYLRNAKIFAKLMTVARPGARVLVVYGAGHGYWLRHFARETPGYRLVDVRPYLRDAVR